MNKIALLGIVIIIALGLGAGSWFLLQGNEDPAATVAESVTAPTTDEVLPQDDAAPAQRESVQAPAADETEVAEEVPSSLDSAEDAIPDPSVPEPQPSSIDTVIRPNDKVFGAEDAPVTLIEYASFTCGHCATFHNETLPELTQAYIDTGLVRFVFRDFPLDGVALRAGMLARCLPDSAYKPMVDLIFQQQQSWARSDDPVLALVGLARNAGLSQEAAQACLADEELAEQIVEMRQEGIETYGVDSTPSFVLEGETFAGALSFEEMAARIDAVLPAN